MRAYRDPTFKNAMDNVMKEEREMAKIAVRIREGRCKPSWAAEKEKMFTGIYRRLLEDPIDDVRKMARL